MSTEPKPRGMRSLLKRWWFWLAAVGLAAIVLAGVVALSTMSDSTEAALGKVKVGMTEAEVDQLFQGHEIRHGQSGSVHGYRAPYRFWRPHRYIMVEVGKDPEMKVEAITTIQIPPESDDLLIVREMAAQHMLQSSATT